MPSGDHFYTLDFKGELAPWAGYEREDFDCFVYASPRPHTVPVHRWFLLRGNVQDHFYTTDPNGELARASGYVSEGIAFHIFEQQQPQTVALNRWFHPTTGDHFYTTDPTGELAPRAGYVREGITGYVFTQPLFGSTQLTRWFLSNKFKFTFDDNITEQQRQTLFERHGWAYYRAGKCSNLTQQQRDEVRTVYERDIIHHGIDNRPGVNASAMVGGRFINVNFNVLFPQGDNEVAMTLLHEMMHCAGYSHPEKGSVPNDVYFATVPLKAEVCIAGFASDVAASVASLAKGTMKQDGTLTHPDAEVPDTTAARSGCYLYGPGTRDEKEGGELVGDTSATANGKASPVAKPRHSDPGADYSRPLVQVHAYHKKDKKDKQPTGQ